MCEEYDSEKGEKPFYAGDRVVCITHAYRAARYGQEFNVLECYKNTYQGRTDWVIETTHPYWNTIKFKAINFELVERKGRKKMENETACTKKDTRPSIKDTYAVFHVTLKSDGTPVVGNHMWTGTQEYCEQKCTEYLNGNPGKRVALMKVEAMLEIRLTPLVRTTFGAKKGRR